MADHTPTEGEVRECFVDGAEGDFIGEDFDRWLTEVRRETWDEVADYLDRTNAPSIAESTRRDNPYRKGETDD